MNPYHSWCLKTFGIECKNFDAVDQVKIPADLADFITEEHNKARMEVARGELKSLISNAIYPQASNMQKLAWNGNLAILAQRLANQCLFHHDTSANRTIPPFKSVGQNLYQMKTTGKLDPLQDSFADAIQAWFVEYKNFPIENLQPFKPSSDSSVQTGHFTALAWAETNQVGCGMTKLKKGKWSQVIIACNYGPGGNILQQPVNTFSVYESGKPCSACAENMTCFNELLCENKP